MLCGFARIRFDNSLSIPSLRLPLPRNQGGLGLRLAQQQHHHAFAASLLTCTSLYADRASGDQLRMHPSTVQRVWPFYVTLHRALTGQDPTYTQPPSTTFCYLPTLDLSLGEDATPQSRPRLQKILQQTADLEVAASHSSLTSHCRPGHRQQQLHLAHHPSYLPSPVHPRR